MGIPLWSSHRVVFVFLDLCLLVLVLRVRSSHLGYDSLRLHSRESQCFYAVRLKRFASNSHKKSVLIDFS